MRGKCEIEDCPSGNVATKIHEDFEAFIYPICWQCGDKLKEIIGFEEMQTLLFYIRLIESKVA